MPTTSSSPTQTGPLMHQPRVATDEQTIFDLDEEEAPEEGKEEEEEEEDEGAAAPTSSSVAPPTGAAIKDKRTRQVLGLADRLWQRTQELNRSRHRKDYRSTALS